MALNRTSVILCALLASSFFMMLKNTRRSSTPYGAFLHSISACKTNSDLFPGTLEEKSWEPAGCTLAEYTADMTAECLEAVPYLAIGDTIGEQVVAHMAGDLRRAGLGGDDVPMRLVWTPSTRVPHFESDRSGRNQREFMTKVAEFATLSLGEWDLGVHWCGTDEFYDGLKTLVLKYKALLKPGARLAMYNMDYINPDKCRESSVWCRTCNTIGKVAVYREIVQMVAVCTGTGMIDTYPITRAGRNHSTDGLHYTSEVVKPKADVLLNVMCGTDGAGSNKLGLWYPNIECNEAEAKARWRRDPVANAHSKGCPDNTNEFGCPNDNGAAARRYLDHKAAEARQKAEEAAKNVGVQTNETSAPQEEVAGTDLPLCKTNEDLFPGKLHDYQWVPEKCRLKFYTKPEIAQCLERKPFAAIGDSLAEQFVFALMRSGGAKVSAKGVWSPSMRWDKLTMSHDGKWDQTDYVTKKVEYAVLSFGVWDIGVHWCGVEDFYHKLKAKILKYRSMLKPSAEMVLHNLHYINTDKPKDGSWAKVCNPTAKVVVYREMVQMAAACTGTKMINTFPLTLQGRENTVDGVHYSEPVMKPKANILMNMMCGADGEGGDRLEPWAPPMECNEEAAMARWLAVPEANRFSKGCPVDNKVRCSDAAQQPNVVDEAETNTTLAVE